MNSGVIGLGAMGAPMARNLAAQGQLNTVYNRTPAKASRLAAECGCMLSTSCAELAQRCELIIICVAADADMLAVVNAMKPAIRPGTIVIDTSTVSIAAAQQAALELQHCQAHFLDCPVSGGVEGAKQGSLTMMVGGEEAVLARAKPALSAIAANIVYMGDSGMGQATKAVNQLMAAGINQAVTEALAFGQAIGLPMEQVINTIATGAAGNWFLSHRGKTMLAGDYATGFKVALHHKDLQICRTISQAIAHDTQLIDMTLADYQSLIDQGYGDEDISALFRLKQKK